MTTETGEREHCRNWIGDYRCGKPAEFIVWGKLYDPDALGPRCYDCAPPQRQHLLRGLSPANGDKKRGRGVKQGASGC